MSRPGDAAPAPEPGAVPGERNRTRPWWLGLATIAWGLIWLHGAVFLPQAATYAVVGPGLFPAVIGGGLVVLGILLLAAIARGERFEPQDAEDADASRAPSRAAFWTTVAAGAVPVLVIRPLGFPVAATIAFALTARAFGSRRLLLDLVVGLLLGVACWALFSRLLGLSLPGFPPLGLS
jgi:putative tricarboxylic transport membrane protein